MKYSILINQLGIVEAGLCDKTDLADWALLEYVSDWQLHGRAQRLHDHVWLNYQKLIDEMPMLGLNKKNSVSNRIAKLVALGLVTICHDDSKRTFAKVTDFYLDIVRFRPGDVIQGVPVEEQGVPVEEQGVPVEEHSINNQLNNQNNLPVVKTKPTDNSEYMSPGDLCCLLSGLGVFGVNPSDVDFLNLLNDGACKEQFVKAVDDAAKQQQRRFRYVLGIVRNQLPARQQSIKKFPTKQREITHETRTRFAENYPWLSASCAEC